MGKTGGWWILMRLVWWSVLLHGSKHKHRRRVYRRHLVSVLARCWGFSDGELETALPLVLSLWLGACLAARSAIRHPIVPSLSRPGARIAGMARRAGGRGVVAAYLAWRWTGTDQPASYQIES